MMASSTFRANHFNFKILHLHPQPSKSHLESIHFKLRGYGTSSISPSFHAQNPFHAVNYKAHLVRARVSGDGENRADTDSQQSAVSNVEPTDSTSSSWSDGYISLFVRMLGLDNDPLDREQAVVTLWKYSLGGKKYVDNLMQFHGCINLTINLLKSESTPACEAAAGLLRTISSVNSYWDVVADSGAIEEITALLSRSGLASEVKEQSISLLWNLSAEEKLRAKIANTELLPLLIRFLDDEDPKVNEATGGVLANLALDSSNHKIMVELGVIPKLAKFLTSASEASKIIRNEAKSALLELAKDDYYKIILLEEGLIPVPLVGVSAYQSFRPALHSWPSLPDGSEFKRTSNIPSRYGASELLLGLNIEDNNVNMDESKMNAIIGRTQQQFLARIGAIEAEDGRKSESKSSSSPQYTLLSWKDGVARLVLILGLEDESAIAKAADSIADASVNEHMRISFKEAGAIKELVRLLKHNNSTIRVAATNALDKLSVSKAVCCSVEAEGAIYPLVATVKDLTTPETLMEKALSILTRLLDPNIEMKSKFNDGPVNGSRKPSDGRSLNGATDFVVNTEEMHQSRSNACEDVLDTDMIARLVDIMKCSSPSLQRKAASILEFMAIIKPCVDSFIAPKIESGLLAVFQQKVLTDAQADIDIHDSDLHPADLEEAGLAISAASRLLTKLLDFDHFQCSINTDQFTDILRKILKSNIPLYYKDWIAAALAKLSSVQADINPIVTEVTLYETIPRLIEQIKTSSSPQAQESAVIELNRIISEGVGDSMGVVAAEDGVYPLVKLIDDRRSSERSVEAGLAILYNLSMDSKNHPMILAAEVVPVLRKIILSERPQWVRALHLLRNLPV